MTVKIFARVFLVYWIAVIAMVALTAVAVTSSPSFGTNRTRTIPLGGFRTCAEHELTLYQTRGTSALQGVIQGCEDGVLLSRDGIPLSGAKLSREDARLATEVADGGNLTIRTSPRETTVAMRLGSGPLGPFIYLATIRVRGHSFAAVILSNVMRLVLVGGAFCYLLTIFFIRPITTLNRVAEQFGAGDLKARVPDGTSLRTDEFGELGRAFNEMATRIESLVARYKVFLAQASHELGSPLTRLNIALALARRSAGPEIHPALSRIGREADNLNSLVQELLLLARLESGNELARKPLSSRSPRSSTRLLPMPVSRRPNRVSLCSYAPGRTIPSSDIPICCSALSTMYSEMLSGFVALRAVSRSPFSASREGRSA